MPERRPSLFLDVLITYEKVGQLVEAALAGTPLAPEDYALFSLIGNEGPFTPTALARRLEMPLTTVLFRVRRLEERGHAERFPNPNDRRSFLIRLTPSGRRLARRVGPAFGGRAHGVLRTLGGDRQRALEDGLAALRSEIDRELASDAAAAVAAR